MTGSLTRRGRGYLMRISLGKNEAGKRLYETRTLNVSKKEAQAILRARLTELDQSSIPREARQSLIGFLQRWLATPALNAETKVRTQADRIAIVKRYLANHEIGKLPLRRVPVMRLQAFFDELLGRLRAGTVRNVRNLLRAAYEQAISWQLVESNPVQRVKLPGGRFAEGGQVRPLTPDEVQLVLALFPELPTQQRALFHLMLTSGLRPGEALGLAWGALDLNACTVRVDRALVRVRGRRGWLLEAPKTRASRRTVTVPPEVMADLAELRERARFTGSEDFVFCGRLGRPLHSEDVRRRWLQPLLKRAGVTTHHVLYDLRHTCATLLLVAGINPKVVAERLGHSGVTITLDTYSAVLPTMQAGAAKRLAEMLYKPGGPLIKPEDPR